MYQYAIFENRGGWFGAIFSAAGLYVLTLPCGTAQAAEEQLSLAAYPRLDRMCTASKLEAELQQYFTGEKVDFSIPIDWSNYTPFQRTVLQYTATIPYGQAVSYGDVAKAISKPKAFRAVGQALHINRTSIVVPCHRVLASGNKLGGFGGGLACKRMLLELENVIYI